MKRTVLLLAAIMAVTTKVFAVSSASPSPTRSDTAQQIENLKDRIATKVAELQKTEKKAMFGKVKSVSVSSITIETKTKDVKIELPDGVVVLQYLKGNRTKLTTGDIDKGDSIAVLGNYDRTVDIMKASVVVIQNTITERLSGTITAISKTDYTLSINGSDGQSYVVDIETTTKAVAWNPTDGIGKGGFSKMAVGDVLQILGTPEKEANRVSAMRILDLGTLAASPQVASPNPAISPTTQSSPSATPSK